MRIDIVWHSWWIGLESQRTNKRRHNGREQNGILLSRNQASVVRRETTASAVRQIRANNTGFYGSVVQLARALACHARGHGFEPRRSRQGILPNQKSLFARVSTVRCAVGFTKRWRLKSPNRALYASLVQLAETLDSNSR